MDWTFNYGYGWNDMNEQDASLLVTLVDKELLEAFCELALSARTVTMNAHIVRPTTMSGDKVEHVPASLRESIGEMRRVLENVRHELAKRTEVDADAELCDQRNEDAGR